MYLISTFNSTSTVISEEGLMWDESERNREQGWKKREDKVKDKERDRTIEGEEGRCKDDEI